MRSNSSLKTSNVLTLQAVPSVDCSDLARQIAHDIRSPMMALSIILQSSPQLPEETRALILGALNRINDMANELLQKSRSSTKAPGNSPKLNDLISQVINESRFLLQSRPELKLEFNCEPSLQAVVLGSVDGLQRVISNLINNAIEAHEGRTGKITVIASVVNGSVQIQIVDTGKGIPSDILQRLGKLGFSHGKACGFGLGLAHARRIVSALGGQLQLESQMGRGTTVSIRLPIQGNHG